MLLFLRKVFKSLVALNNIISILALQSLSNFCYSSSSWRALQLDQYVIWPAVFNSQRLLLHVHDHTYLVHTIHQSLQFMLY